MAVLLSVLGWTVASRQASPPSPVATVRAPLIFQKESLRNFTITKRPPLLVTPNRPTPTQPLYLTNVDDSFSLRAHANELLFYGSRYDSSTNNSGKTDDPVKVIGEALGKLLVGYYPFAGRLRRADKGKLIVDCNGEGVLFVEADADVSLEDLGDLSAPIPRALEFINNVQPWDPVTDSPLLLCQVTRLQCGGFVLGLHFSHCMTDGVGIAQFLIALSEIARGAATPTVPPVWNREILRPRAKPMVKSLALRLHNDFVIKSRASAVLAVPVPAEEEMSTKSFYFGPKEIGSLKRQVKGVKHCTTFEVISACLWQSRTKALNIPAHHDSILMFPFNARSRFRPRLPTGYYGNAIAGVYAKTTAQELTTQPLSFAVKLINEEKKRVDEEYIRSMVDLAELNGRPLRPPRGCYIISDVAAIARATEEADFGWGKAVYGCPASTLVPGVSYLVRASMKDYEGIRVPVCLPSNAMEIFEENVNKSINGGMHT